MIKKITVLFLAIFVANVVTQTANAQIFDAIKKIKKEVEKTSKKTETKDESSNSTNNNSNNGNGNASADSKSVKNASSKIIFSATPFAAGDTQSKQTEFVFGQPIYGRVFLNYSYRDIFTEKELAEERDFQIYIYKVDKQMGQDVIRSYGNAFRKIYPSEFDQKVFDFVLNPDAQAAKNYPIQSDLGAAFRGFFSSEEFAGQKFKLTAEVTLLDQNGNKGEEVSSDFWLDYSKATRKSLLEYFDVSEENRKIAEENAVSYQAKSAAAAAKNSALPSFFTNPPKNAPGYTGVTNAQILQLIKRAYGVTQVSLFRFEDNGAEEYGVVANDLGIPVKMQGYRLFLLYLPRSER